MYIIGVILITGSDYYHYIYDILHHTSAAELMYFKSRLNPQGIGYNVLQSILAVIVEV